jgi:hypothetical protein
MRRFRENPLPGEVMQVRTIKDSLTAAFNLRAQVIPQMSGYPVPMGVVAMARRLLNFSSLNSLKEGIMSLRDCARFASDLLATLRIIKVERLQFDLNQIYTYAQSHASEMGYHGIAGDETKLYLSSYLIVSSELIDNAWNLSVTSEVDNPLIHILKLYDQLRAPSGAYTVTISEPKGALEVAFAGGTSPKYFFPESGALEPLHAIAFNRDELGELYKQGVAITDSKKRAAFENTLADRLKDEAAIYRLADMRLIDHMFDLFMDTDVWNSFITKRQISAEEANDQRGDGLKMFAAYLQSLLLYPHIFRYELFKESYSIVERWHGNLPAVSSSVMTNYENLISAYDFLKAKEDVVSLLKSYEVDKDVNTGTKVIPMFKEVMQIYGLEDKVKELETIKVPGVLAVSDLSTLASPEVQPVLQSFPLAEFRLSEDIVSRLSKRERFKEVTSATYNLLAPGYNRWFNPTVNANIRALGLTCSFPFHAYISGSVYFDKGYSPRFQRGKYGFRYNAIYASALANYDVSRYLDRDGLKPTVMYKMMSARELKTLFPDPPIAIDIEIGDKIRKVMNRTWQSMYPATLTDSARMMKVGILLSDDLQFQRLFETMSNQSYEFIKREMEIPEVRKIWATFLSSFALLYHRNSASSNWTMSAGDAYPYGLTFGALETLQNFDLSKDVKALPGLPNVGIALLKKFPTPGFELALGTYGYGEPYYYYKGVGNGNAKEITYVVWDEGCLHYGLRPVATIGEEAYSKYYFDKGFAYANDTFIMQINSRFHFDSGLVNEEQTSIALTERAWKNEIVSSFVKYIMFGKYSTAATPGAPVEKEQSISKLLKEMDKEAEDVYKKNPVIAEGDKDKPEVVSEATIAAEAGDIVTAGDQARHPIKEALPEKKKLKKG